MGECVAHLERKWGVKVCEMCHVCIASMYRMASAVKCSNRILWGLVSSFNVPYYISPPNGVGVFHDAGFIVTARVGMV